MPSTLRLNRAEDLTREGRDVERLEKLDHFKELVDRTRRIETRLTRYLESQGFDTQSKKPLWRDGVVQVPSRRCSLQDCLEVVPAGWDPARVIRVLHAGEELLRFTLPRG